MHSDFILFCSFPTSAIETVPSIIRELETAIIQAIKNQLGSGILLSFYDGTTIEIKPQASHKDLKKLKSVLKIPFAANAINYCLILINLHFLVSMLLFYPHIVADLPIFLYSLYNYFNLIVPFSVFFNLKIEHSSYSLKLLKGLMVLFSLAAITLLALTIEIFLNVAAIPASIFITIALCSNCLFVFSNKLIQAHIHSILKQYQPAIVLKDSDNSQDLTESASSTSNNDPSSTPLSVGACLFQENNPTSYQEEHTVLPYNPLEENPWTNTIR